MKVTIKSPSDIVSVINSHGFENVTLKGMIDKQDKLEYKFTVDKNYQHTVLTQNLIGLYSSDNTICKLIYKFFVYELNALIDSGQLKVIINKDFVRSEVQTKRLY